MALNMPFLAYLIILIISIINVLKSKITVIIGSFFLQQTYDSLIINFF